MPLDGLRLSRGTYGMNKKLSLISATDGTSLLADRLEKVVELFREPLGTAGIGLTQTAAEEWQIRTGW
jgi:pyruvate dehydrogenase complex dehydrogenase (E1) component